MGENNNNNNNNKNNNENNSRTAEGAAWPPPNAPSLPAVPLQRTSCDEASRITSHPPPPSGLHMQTCTYAHHDGIALQCDVYAGPDFPQHLPVFLYFHAGGLVAWDRKHVPPWLVQTCYERRWPLVSASYRLLPQAQGRELRADAKAAFSFATTLNTAFGVNRKIIAGGSSAGFFLAALLAHERLSCLVALVSIYGIPSFQHEFFRSSTMLTPEPIASDAMKRHEEGPMTAWVSEAGEPEVFLVQMLNPDGSRNRDYVPIVEEHSSVGGEGDKELGLRRGLLYEYYVYNNSFPELVHPVDPGFNEPTKENLGWRLCWPPTVVIHGRDDVDFPLGGSLWMRDAILEDKVRVFIAEGKGHLFELGLFLEDGNGGMDVVKRAIEALDEMVQSVV